MRGTLKYHFGSYPGTPSESADAVGGGALFAMEPGRGIFAHREPDGMLHSYMAVQKPMACVAQVQAAGPDAALARVAREFEGWNPALTALITDGVSAPVFRPIHALPAAHRWDRIPGVTRLGDAAHLMAPAGDGANWGSREQWNRTRGQAIGAYRGSAGIHVVQRQKWLNSLSRKANSEIPVPTLPQGTAPLPRLSQED